MAWIFAFVTLVAGIIAFNMTTAADVQDILPKDQFGSGETRTVLLDPERGPAIYASSKEPVNYTCNVTGGPGKAVLARPLVEQKYEYPGYTWELIQEIKVEQTGTYQISCVTERQVGTAFGVGRSLSSGNTTEELFIGVALLIAIPGLGVVVAAAMTIVVLVRRRAYRRRLAAGWHPGG
ncbi:hypothetical protein [Sinosporangium siamense]|uniref:hypothetical protein n=1 Tax=Sinosporangium siamense TaxID=1367973 RepID=UPI00194F65A8|nr:hypothetical protein [Sinosporangium siamense]